MQFINALQVPVLVSLSLLLSVQAAWPWYHLLSQMSMLSCVITDVHNTKRSYKLRSIVALLCAAFLASKLSIQHRHGYKPYATEQKMHPRICTMTLSSTQYHMHRILQFIPSLSYLPNLRLSSAVALWGSAEPRCPDPWCVISFHLERPDYAVSTCMNNEET